MKLSDLSRKPWYKWVIVVACFFMVMMCLGFCSSNKSMYLGAITEALGFQRSVFSLNDSIRYIAQATANLFFGALMARFGARKLLAGGFACMVASTLLYATSSQLWGFYLGGFFLGLGLAMCTTTMVSYLVNLWHPEKRGTISGAILCANGVGGAIAAQIVSPMINDAANPFGYRKAYLLVAVLMVITGIVVTLLIREPHESKGQVAKKKPRGKQWVGISFQEALRKPYFYAAAIGVFLTGMSLQGIDGTSAAHMKDVGLAPEYVATVLSVSSITLAATKFLTGFSYDKLGLRITILIAQFCGFVSFTCLAFCDSSSTGQTLAMVYGVLSRLALPLETVIVPLVAAELFGEKDFSKLLGIFVALNTAGYAVGNPLCNLVFDKVGTYSPMLIIMGALLVVLAVMFQFIITAAGKVHKQVEAMETAE